MHRMAGVLSLGAALFVASGNPAVAQGWPPWAEDLFGPSFGYPPSRRAPEKRLPEGRRDWGDYVRGGGARPVIAPMAPPEISFPHDYPASSIVIDTGKRKLYYVLPDKRAYEYSIGVGREGFGWTGAETVSRKQAWPDWYPPAEMRARDPRLPAKMLGGIRNPLGAMALYLGNSLYRIHGTNDPKSIGRAESSGCFRMLNSYVLHLAALAEIGTPVAVVSSLAKQKRAPRVPDSAKGPEASSQSKDAMPAASDRVR